MKKTVVAVLTLAFLSLLALSNPKLSAQVSTIIQSGPWAVGHLGCYVGMGSSQAVMADCGPAGGVGTSSGSTGVSEFLQVATGPPGQAPYAGLGSGDYGTIDCRYDAPIDNPTGYHVLCFSPNAQGGGLLTYNARGSASPLPFQCIINGILISPCFGGGGSSGFTPNIRLITTGNVDAVAPTDVTVVWDSAVASTKTETAPDCGPANKARILTFKDMIGSAQAFPITISAPSSTIDGSATFVLRTNKSSMTMQCDGISNYVVL